MILIESVTINNIALARILQAMWEAGQQGQRVSSVLWVGPQRGAGDSEGITGIEYNNNAIAGSSGGQGLIELIII